MSGGPASGPADPSEATLRHRQAWAETLLDRLNPAMGLLGVIFVLVVLGEQLSTAGTAVADALTVAGWVLWAIFVTEFVVRVVVAPDRRRFLRRHWWEVVFLALPFLRFLRLVRTMRLLRAGRVVSSAVRGSRSAPRVFGSRLGYLAGVVAIVILASSQLLYQFSDYPRYAGALHDAALAAITGEPLRASDPFAQVFEVVLALFSVIVFGSFAAMFGAFLVERRAADEAKPEGPGR